MKHVGQAQKFIIYPYIRLVTQAENKDLPKEEKFSSEETMLINKKWDLVIIAQENVPRMKKSSARQSRGHKRWFINKGDDPGNSVGADKHCKDIR